MRPLALELAAAQQFFEIGFALLKVSNRRPFSKTQARTTSGPTRHPGNRNGIRLKADPDSRSPFLKSFER